MLVSFFKNKIGRGFVKLSLSCVSMMMLIAVYSSEAKASTCYHHYNSYAWHGTGMAIVFCLNSGDTHGGSPMVSCGAYDPKNGDKLTSFWAHSNTDHGRQVFTDSNTPGSTYGSDPLVIVCKGKNGKIYSYPIANASNMSYPGTCDVSSGYIGSSSQCTGDSDPLLTLNKGGKGKGRVIGNQLGLYGGKIDCGATCSSDQELFYNHLDQVITLTAIPEKGYMFAGWAGDCTGTDNCTVKMTENKTVTANFDQIPPTIAPISLLLRPYYSIGGSVSGLASGNSVALSNSNGDKKTVSRNGSFAFETELLNGEDYRVSVVTNPTTPNQTCTVSNSLGSVRGSHITNIAINCVTKKYTVGGTLTGVAGSTNAVLQNNGGDNLSIGSNGSFTFATPINDYSNYNVTVKTSPTAPNQTCTVSNGSGTLSGGPVSSVAINCVTNKYTVGGMVSGFDGGSSGVPLTLRNNAAEELHVNANGSFTFDTALDDLSSYAVTVLTHPTIPNQTCTVSSGFGNLSGANVTNVVVECVTTTYSVGVTVTGFAGGTEIVLQNNGGDDLTISSNVSVNFATTIADESNYNVTVFTDPTGPNQVCTVTSGSGTIHQAPATGIAVDCVTVQYTINGAVTGLGDGESVTLQNNSAADTETVWNSNTNYIFGTSFDDGSDYSITATVDGSGRACVVTDESGDHVGTINGGSVANVNVDCAPQE